MDRKQIVKALGDHFGVKPSYMGAPSFAYQVTTADEIYTIDRTGKIVTSTDNEVTLESIINKVVEEAPPTSCEVTIPLAVHTAVTLRNMVNLLYSKQDLIIKSLGTGSLIIEEDFVKALNVTHLESTEDFKGVLARSGDDPCPGISFDFDADTVTFAFLGDNPSPEKIQAYTQLVALLNQTALSLKYTSAKPIESDNPKFTLRLFLVRLGMVGDEYKIARKVLLETLEGNSAYRSGKR